MIKILLVVIIIAFLLIIISSQARALSKKADKSNPTKRGERSPFEGGDVIDVAADVVSEVIDEDS